MADRDQNWALPCWSMGDRRGDHGWSRARLDAVDVVFAVLVIIAGPIIAYLNRAQWFYGDDFAFVFKRNIGEPASLLRPHWGHLTALPAALYQLLYRVVGLDHYWPYQWLVIGAHLSVVVLARALMRRVGVHLWLATSSATALLFLGSGRENLAWGFQVTLTGSIAFGLGALVALTPPVRSARSRRDDPVAPAEPGEPAAPAGGRRDLHAGLLLVGSVLCSNVGVVMTIVAAAAVWALGGDRRRLATVVGPPALVFMVWSAVAPRSEFEVPTSGPIAAVTFAAEAVSASAGKLMGFGPLAVAVAAVLVGGAATARRNWNPGDRQRHAVPAALLAGTVASAVLLGHARAADTFVKPDTSRYVYLLVSLLIVPLTVALNELAASRALGRRAGPDRPAATPPARATNADDLVEPGDGDPDLVHDSESSAPVVTPRGRVRLALACAFVLVGLPANLGSLSPPSGDTRTGSAAETTHLAALAAESGLPDELVVTGELTVGDLARAHQQGRLPDPPDDPEAAGRAVLLLAFGVGAEPTEGCRDMDGAQPVTIQEGQSLGFESRITVDHADRGQRRGRLEVAVAGQRRAALVVRWGPVAVWAKSDAGPVRVCG